MGKWKVGDYVMPRNTPANTDYFKIVGIRPGDKLKVVEYVPANATIPDDLYYVKKEGGSPKSAFHYRLEDYEEQTKPVVPKVDMGLKAVLEGEWIPKDDPDLKSTINSGLQPGKAPDVSEFPYVTPVALGKSKEADPYGKSAKEAGSKLDAGKSPVFQGLLDYFPRACAAVADVSGKGAEKYAWKGWETVPDGENRYRNAAIRHVLMESVEGRKDQDGFIHRAQVAWNALASLELMLRREEKEKQFPLDYAKAHSGLEGAPITQ